jgi:hypothetical protein
MRYANKRRSWATYIAGANDLSTSAYLQVAFGPALKFTDASQCDPPSLDIKKVCFLSGIAGSIGHMPSLVGALVTLLSRGGPGFLRHTPGPTLVDGSHERERPNRRLRAEPVKMIFSDAVMSFSA